MNEAELVSIITPSYNSGKFISAMIDSILAQTYTNWELLITDDCSSDNSCQLIQEYCERDPRIKLYQLSQNSGAGVARNNSLQHANGKYIAFCDSDDLWLPEKLEQQISFMRELSLKFSYTSYLTSSEDGVINGIVRCPAEVNYKNIVRGNDIGCLTVVYDAEEIHKRFFPNIRKRQDWALWINIIREIGTVKGLNVPLSIYRQRADSISSSKTKLLKHNLYIYTHVLGFNMTRAVFELAFNFLPHYFFKKLKQKKESEAYISK